MDLVAVVIFTVSELTLDIESRTFSDISFGYHGIPAREYTSVPVCDVNTGIAFRFARGEG